MYSAAIFLSTPSPAFLCCSASYLLCCTSERLSCRVGVCRQGKHFCFTIYNVNTTTNTDNILVAVIKTDKVSNGAEKRRTINIFFIYNNDLLPVINCIFISSFDDVFYILISYLAFVRHVHTNYQCELQYTLCNSRSNDDIFYIDSIHYKTRYNWVHKT